MSGKDFVDLDLLTFMFRFQKIKPPIILQINSVKNVLASETKQEHEPRSLMLSLSDGHTHINAIELQHVRELSVAIPPGTKLKIKSETQIKHGFLILESSRIEVLGGQVPSLVQAWTLKKESRSLFSRKISTRGEDEDPPPKFHPLVLAPPPAKPAPSTNKKTVNSQPQGPPQHHQKNQNQKPVSQGQKQTTQPKMKKEQPSQESQTSFAASTASSASIKPQGESHSQIQSTQTQTQTQTTSQPQIQSNQRYNQKLNSSQSQKQYKVKGEGNQPQRNKNQYSSTSTNRNPSQTSNLSSTISQTDSKPPPPPNLPLPSTNPSVPLVASRTVSAAVSQPISTTQQQTHPQHSIPNSAPKARDQRYAQDRKPQEHYQPKKDRKPQQFYQPKNSRSTTQQQPQSQQDNAHYPQPPLHYQPPHGHVENPYFMFPVPPVYGDPAYGYSGQQHSHQYQQYPNPYSQYYYYPPQ
eukprot:TRINITY_DN2729_c0_g1_i1.p1 TRINITY_DN2729_c0_g1~~TRINITY_DN2729_c0_g1_i1.p1  ORF type:complete len:466 (-),score=98.39 TRINITY_DN2729_c0_g1_i1:139-1536(-)